MFFLAKYHQCHASHGKWHQVFDQPQHKQLIVDHCELQLSGKRSRDEKYFQHCQPLLICTNTHLATKEECRDNYAADVWLATACHGILCLLLKGDNKNA